MSPFISFAASSFWIPSIPAIDKFSMSWELTCPAFCHMSNSSRHTSSHCLCSSPTPPALLQSFPPVRDKCSYSQSEAWHSVFLLFWQWEIIETKSVVVGNKSNYSRTYTNKRHRGANDFVPCREVVPISESHLSEVPLYYTYSVDSLHWCIFQLLWLLCRLQ